MSFVIYHGSLEANNWEVSYISITLHSNAIVYRWKVVKRYATNDAQSDISCCPNIHRITLLSRCVVVFYAVHSRLVHRVKRRERVCVCSNHVERETRTWVLLLHRLYAIRTTGKTEYIRSLSDISIGEHSLAAKSLGRLKGLRGCHAQVDNSWVTKKLALLALSRVTC